MTAREERLSARTGIALVLLAVALRLIEYLHNKAIWLDEAHLALNIVQRDYLGLTRQLDYGQGAPLGFLWIERFAANAAGPSEFALRFAPMLASILTCGMLYVFLRRMLPARATTIPLAIFAVAVPVIRYASEVKPYATDLLVSIILLLVLLPLAGEWNSNTRAIAALVVGSVAVWFAFPAIFLLAGIGVVLAAQAIFAKQWARMFTILAAGVFWVASFALDYVFLLRYNADNAEVRSWWLDRFTPLPPKSLSDLNWFVRSFFEMFDNPLGLGAGGVGAFLFLIGAFALWRRDRLRLCILLAPLCVALIASGLQKYPFTGRFLLFSVPLLLVCIGEGWTFLAENVRNRVVLVVVAAVLLVQPTAGAVRGAVKPAEEGVRPAFDYVDSHWQPDDKLYVYHWAGAPFAYYEWKAARELPKIAGIPSRANWSGYAADIDTLRDNARVWIVLTNTPKQLVGQEDKFILTYLDTIGRRVQAGVFPESGAYLYDLSKAPVHD